MSDKMQAVSGVVQILTEQLGGAVRLGQGQRLLEDLGATSLDMASIQLEVEDHFGLKFADGAGARQAMDVEWDNVKTPDDLVELIEKYTPAMTLVESSGPYVMKGDTLQVPTYADLYRIEDKEKK